MNQHGAYILARYSTDHQNPDSIEVQVDKCTEWCCNEGIPVLDVFADYATSGMKESRPGYDRMMRQLAAGGADTVVIYDMSRMFRSMTAWFNFRDELAKKGIRAVSVTQPNVGGDLRDPTNFLTEGSMALFNQMWVLQTRQKVIEKMRFMAKNGQHTGGKPALGYQVVDGRLEICEPEAAIVRKIFADYAAGQTYNQIITDLNSAGVKTKLGNAFGKNSLHDLLKNEKYIGVLTYFKTETRPDGRRNNHSTPSPNCIRIEGAVPAIIDMNTWERVQSKMASNKRGHAGRPPVNRDYPLKGKVFCGECGSTMIVTCSKGKYYYYACSGKQRKCQCDNTPIPVSDLEQRVADTIRQYLGTPGNIDELLQILRESRDDIQGSAATRLKAMIERANKIDTQLAAALDAVLGGLNSPTLTQRVNALEAEKARLERDMKALKASVDGSAISDAQIKKLLTEIVSSPDISAILSAVVRVEVSKTDIRIWTILDADEAGNFDFSTRSGEVIEIDGAGNRDRTCTPLSTRT